ncbi:MAG TPA: hypothetical protein VFU22_26135 [Roseiflexaceae bacterium]|nr:hypothetical protein [Roseiflexaceae bacterium]
MTQPTAPRTIDLSNESIYALAATALDQQIWFAACDTGLYRSLDQGATWQDCYAALATEEPLLTTALALSPDFARDRSVFTGGLGGVLRSLDGGDSWFVGLLPTPPPLVSALAISPDFSHDGMLLAATMEDGIFRSADRAASWQSCNFGLLDLHVLALAISPDFANDQTIFAGTESGIFRSTNGGRAWRELAFPEECAPVLSLALSPAYGEDGVAFAGTEASGLFRTTDRGQTWGRIGESLTAAINTILITRSSSGDVLLALHDSALLCSRDRGQTWSACPHVAPDQEVVAISTSEPLVIASADGTTKGIDLPS